LYTTPASELDKRKQEEVYKVVEMQVSLIHDLFYTKVELMYTWYGFCIRILALLATAVAFLLFNMLLLSNDYRKLMNGGYSKVDVVVTNVLFVGAIILDCVSLFRAMYSTWTCALLIEWRRDRCWSRRCPPTPAADWNAGERRSAITGRTQHTQ
jgi:hypothetical protein